MTAEPFYDIYWLGFLLTGDRERALETVIETMDGRDPANPFFAKWFVQWSRKVFIAKVLGSVTPQSTAGELRRRFQKLNSEARRDGLRPVSPTMDKTDLQAALLEIDWFPRCALVLRVFEKLSVEDVAILLNADRERVKTATAIGLMELSRNLAGTWTSPSVVSEDYEAEVCHV
jgi:hypothetical protein